MTGVNERMGVNGVSEMMVVNGEKCWRNAGNEWRQRALLWVGKKCTSPNYSKKIEKRVGLGAAAVARLGQVSKFAAQFFKNQQQWINVYLREILIMR